MDRQHGRNQKFWTTPQCGPKLPEAYRRSLRGTGGYDINRAGSGGNHRTTSPLRVRPLLPGLCNESSSGMNIYTVHIADWHHDGWALRAVREMVFIREQGVPAELEWDELDACGVHLIAMDAARN